MPPPTETAWPPVDVDRLNGWKEIAAFLGKSVRTVQRWEREFGLPVHRLGSNRGEIVFASKNEITRWTRTAAQARATVRTPGSPDDVPRGLLPEERFGPGSGAQPGTTARSRLTPGWMAALVTIAAAAVATWAWVGRGADTRDPAADQPANWRVEDDRLTVLNSSGRVLWSHHFGIDLQENTYEPYAIADQGLPPPVRIEDLDNDGSREVLFAVKAVGVTRPSVHVFEADGRLRFSHGPPTGTLRFGGTDYAPEWLIMGTWTTTNSHNERSIWLLYYQKPNFPSLLTQIDTHGAVRSEYVSNGYIRTVQEARWRGIDTVLVGAVNNETRGGSLAIFEGGRVRGSAPAGDPKYRCENCPPGGPEHFLVFPRTCLSTWPGTVVPVSTIWVDASDQVWASVQHDHFVARQAGDVPGTILYPLDQNLAPVRVELTGSFGRLHQLYEAAGMLDHVLDATDAARALPVRSWNGSHFVDLPRVPVEIDR